jgi:bile acid-coenzyme A ligase
MMATPTQEKISYGRRLSMLAAEHPDKPALIFVPIEGAHRTVTYRELDLASNRIARLFAEHHVNEQSLVVVGLPNCPEHYLATYAAWKLGALVLPMRANLPNRERDQMLELGKPTLVVSEWQEVSYPTLSLQDLHQANSYSDAPHPDRIPHPGKSIGSGGSTGRSKIIVDPNPLVVVPLADWEFGRSGLRAKQVQLVAGPLYHNSPFSWGHHGLMQDHTLILMEKFDAARAIDLIEQYRVNFGFLAPTMMQRIIREPNVYQRDFSSVQGILHTAAPCPPWLRRAWIELIGGDQLHEGFGATENVGHTQITGSEWLKHPGSVGKPMQCDLRILDENGNDLPTGQVGEIFMRRHHRQPTYYYLGSPPAKTTPDGFTSVGDMGWVDEEGYLYLADRRVDLIISGGANIYPAEVEAALTEHPNVGDVAVIGLPDDEWGKTVHAIIQLRDPNHPPTIMELDQHCRARIASYKAPKSYEFMTESPRDQAGKVRRTGLIAERANGNWHGIIVAKDAIAREAQHT